MYSRETALKLLQHNHICSYCGEILFLCEEPEIGMCDGLGWGGFIYICLSDNCSCLETSEEFKDKFSKKAMTRYARLPGEKKGFCIPVYCLDACKQLVITEKDLERKELERLKLVMDKKEEKVKEAQEDFRAAKRNYLDNLKGK